MTRQGKSEITYLEEIMNTRMFKVFQGHVIACSHVLISHSLLKTLPSQIFIFNKVHGNPLRRLTQTSQPGIVTLDRITSIDTNKSTSKTWTDGY